MRRPVSPLLCLGLLLSCPGSASGVASGDLSSAGTGHADAWRDTSLGLHSSALDRFGEDTDREARLGRSALLLLRHPKTAGNLERAVVELETLAAASPADEVAVSARYLLGRVAQIHRQPADLAAAASHFRRLLEDAPGHPLADQALIKLALIELYAPEADAEARVAAHERFLRAAQSLRRPASRRDLFLVLADSARRHGLGDERTLEHYLAADAAGLDRPVLRSDVTIAIAELALRTGRPELARRYYERFLREFQRDNRRDFATGRLASLPSAEKAPDTP